MIAVDTSALMAIVLDEPQAESCMAAIETADGLLISAGTVAEALIVSARRGGACVTRSMAWRPPTLIIMQNFRPDSQ